jgi:hypothetical protein
VCRMKQLGTVQSAEMSRSAYILNGLQHLARSEPGWLDLGPTKGTVRCDPVRTSSHWKGAYGHFIFGPIPNGMKFRGKLSICKGVINAGLP